MKSFWKDKVFLKSMIAIALPITLQNLITSSLNMVDTLMISSLGEASIAGVGLANQIYFFYSVLVFGVASGASIFIAQLWGKEDTSNIKRILGLSTSLSSMIGLIFTILAFFTPQYLMRIFTKDVEVIKIGSDYLRIVSFSYIINAVSISYGVASRSIGDAKMPMRVSGISFLVNTFFNWLLIFGKLGFPALGVKGAAYGTLIARIVEVIFTLYAIYSDRQGVLAGNIKELTSWNKDFIFSFLKTSYPVILNEGFWSLGMVMYSIAYARIGKEAAAAVQISNTVLNVFMVIARGLANACTVMVGNKIGAGEEDEAITYGMRYLIIATTSGILLGIVLYFSSDLILKMFRNLTPELYNTSKKMLTVIALFFFVKTFNATMIVGILRGGGDTTFSMLLELGTVWLVGVPLAFIGALVLKLPVYLVQVLITADEVVKAIIGIPRIVSKKWVRNVTESI
ncbi:MATE family efflux transporter [Tissierella sp. MSJ-40]|uniref:MATE family efflux transporter n=1 Tax=Tissierella simiarum TaxID=2841534 RepID=A0ABS6E355_9FIRM|nr:MATE family efflux transporter [Tissierella simiarum]MBU5437343.1 MATE family efflux transporter [Tissierella simiarum]